MNAFESLKIPSPRSLYSMSIQTTPRKQQSYESSTSGPYITAIRSTLSANLSEYCESKFNIHSPSNEYKFGPRSKGEKLSKASLETPLLKNPGSNHSLVEIERQNCNKNSSPLLSKMDSTTKSKKMLHSNENDLKPKYHPSLRALPTLLKEVFKESTRPNEKYSKGGSIQHIQHKSLKSISKIPPLTLNSVSLPKADAIDHQPLSKTQNDIHYKLSRSKSHASILAISKHDSAILGSASNANGQRQLELSPRVQTSREHYLLPNTAYLRNPYVPARYQELNNTLTVTHRSASDTLYYENHAQNISGRATDRVKMYQGHMSGSLGSYRQKMNENFENRFGSQQLKKLHDKKGSAGNEYGFSGFAYDEDQELGEVYQLLGKHNSVSPGQGEKSAKSTSKPRLNTLQNFSSEDNLLRGRRGEGVRFQRPVVAGLPDHAKLKLPGSFDKKNFIRRGQKKKMLYNPFIAKNKTDELSFNKEEEALRTLITLNPKMGPILPPQNPLFKTPAKNQTMQEIIVDSLHLRLFRPRKLNFKIIRMRLIEALRYMKLLKLTPRDFIDRQIFSSMPYQKKNSKELIDACKIGNQEKVSDLLKSNRFLVYDYDHAHMTSLHWAVKRNHFKIVEILIYYGADLNAHDLIGRTPLYFALENNQINVLKLLLYSFCDPWSTEECNYQELEMDKPLARYYLSKCRQIHILMMMTPARLRDSLWKHQSMNLILDPERLRCYDGNMMNN